MLYFQFNRMNDWKDEPFTDFTKRLFRAYDEHIEGIDKFIIDLRFNDGGNGYLLPPHRLERHIDGTRAERTLGARRVLVEAEDRSDGGIERPLAGVRR